MLIFPALYGSRHPTRTVVAAPAVATRYIRQNSPCHHQLGEWWRRRPTVGSPVSRFPLTTSTCPHPSRPRRLMESLLASRSIRSSFSAVASTRGAASPRPSRVATLASAGAGARSRALRAGHTVRPAASSSIGLFGFSTLMSRIRCGGFLFSWYDFVTDLDVQARITEQCTKIYRSGEKSERISVRLFGIIICLDYIM
jgi:hypothetical protein